MQNIPTPAPVEKTDAEIESIAYEAIIWARGSWGQGRHDPSRYSPADAIRIHKAIAVLALAEAERLAFQTEI
jgi:hypothetical protein